MCYLAAICCDPFSEHVGDVCLPLACSFPLLVCPVVLGTQGIKQQGFRLPVLRVAVPVSCLYWGGLGYGQCMLRNTTWLLHACVSAWQPGACSATCCEQTFSPARPPYQCHGIALARLSGCVFSVKSGLLRHVAEEGCGMLQAGPLRGTCLQCAGIRVQKGVVCVCALARDRLSEMHACVHHVCVSDCTCLRGLVCVVA